MIDIGQKPTNPRKLIQETIHGLTEVYSFGMDGSKINQQSPNVDKLSMTEFLQKLVSLNEKIQALEYDEVWGEVDSVQDLDLYKNTTHTF